MTSARKLRARAWRVGATATLTLVASGVITAGTTSAASADQFCEYAGASTFATGSVNTIPVCGDTADPYSCTDPNAGLGTTFTVWANLCVID